MRASDPPISTYTYTWPPTYGGPLVRSILRLVRLYEEGVSWFPLAPRFRTDRACWIWQIQRATGYTDYSRALMMIDRLVELGVLHRPDGVDHLYVNGPGLRRALDALQGRFRTLDDYRDVPVLERPS